MDKPPVEVQIYPVDFETLLFAVEASASDEVRADVDDRGPYISAGRSTIRPIAVEPEAW